jgi:beta-1,4-mannosyl-glycoprotein beta-1,4-N-acetylglucosaminyltransferase
MNKVIDCLMFYNELDMLRFRLEHLNDVVDYFIIAEATVTHQNSEKKLFFEENKHLFSEYLDKIIHVVVEDMPGGYSSTDNWAREKHQRISLIKGVEKLNLNPTDIIMLSCCDEIPNNKIVKEIKEYGINIFQSDKNLKYKPGHTAINDYNNGISLFYMDMYWFNLTTKNKDSWTLSRACTYDKLIEMGGFQPFIDNKTDIYYLLGGWHFTYFGSKEFMITKIKSFAHDEYNKDEYLDINKLDRKIKNKQDIFNRPHENLFNIEILDNSFLPNNYKFLLNNKNFEN